MRSFPARTVFFALLCGTINLMTTGCGDIPPPAEGCERVDLEQDSFPVDLCLKETHYNKNNGDVSAIINASSPEGRNFPEVLIGLRAGVVTTADGTEGWLSGSDLVWMPLEKEMPASGKVSWTTVSKYYQEEKSVRVMAQFRLNSSGEEQTDFLY